MKVSLNSWKAYVKKLSAIDKRAASEMKKWITENGTADMKALAEFAYALATKYGEASAALVCEMYDETALLEGVSVPLAEPAATATLAETSKAVNKAKLQSELVIPQAVGKLVKMAGQDTVMQNARRDDAWWAWIPHGDTCAFCIALAANGWQRQSGKNKHAEHIHANCDCSYQVSFSPFGNVEGYDPDTYLEKYENASDGNSKAKINALRREHYAQNKDFINAQKRLAYAKNHDKDS